MKKYSWKTTLSGICAIIPIILHALFPTVVTVEVAASLTGVFISLGLIAAKDGNVTGGTKPVTFEAENRTKNQLK
jgi:hypothetical protein